MKLRKQKKCKKDEGKQLKHRERRQIEDGEVRVQDNLTTFIMDFSNRQ